MDKKINLYECDDNIDLTEDVCIPEVIVTKNQMNRDKLRRKLAEQRAIRKGEAPPTNKKTNISACMKDPEFMKKFNQMAKKMGVEVPQGALESPEIRAVLNSM